ncbi:MAG: xylose isomerase [Chthonomonadaceae bacterium]|nr:xylose isomerase [Chthonomonadaceae bacterium]
MDAFGYLETCRYRYGLDTADFWNGLIGTVEADTLVKIRQGVEEREMQVVNYHVDGVHLWEDDPNAREANYRKAWEHLHAAVALGAKTVRFDTGGKLTTMTEEQCDFLAGRYREYCRFAAENGFRIGPENHWGLSLFADNMERLARAVDHPAYGILMHLGHWEDCDPVEGDRRLASWTVHTHVDARVSRTDLAERMQVLLDANYTGCWGVEHHTAHNEYAEVGYQLAEVRRVLAHRRWQQQDAETTSGRESKTRNPLLTAEQEGHA